MAKLGADVEQVLDLAQVFEHEARLLETSAQEINSRMRDLKWWGPFHDQFLFWWNSREYRNLTALAQRFNELADGLKRQAQEQLATSDSSTLSIATRSDMSLAAISERTHVVRSEELTIGTLGSVGAGIISLDAYVPTRVTYAELSDGTYRIAISSSADFDASVLQDSIEIGGVTVLDVGAEAGTSFSSYEQVYIAQSEDGAQAIRAELEARAASLSNRTIVGGHTEIAELADIKALERADVEAAGFTAVGANIYGDIDASPFGASEGKIAARHETFYGDGVAIDRTVLAKSGDEGGFPGWNLGETAQQRSYEIHRFSDGNTGFVIHHEVTSLEDVRSGAAKVRDTFLGSIMPGDPNTDMDISLTRDSYFYSMEDLESVDGAKQLFDSGDKIGLGQLMWEHREEFAVHEMVRQEGSSDSSTRGLDVGILSGGSMTERGSMNLVERTVKGE